MLVHQRGDPKQSTGVGAFRPVPTTNVQEKFLPSNAVKEFKDLDLVGARLSWRINGLGDPSRAFRALALIGFVAGLRLEVKDRFCRKRLWVVLSGPGGGGFTACFSPSNFPH